MAPDPVNGLMMGLAPLVASAFVSPLLARRRRLAGSVNLLLTLAAATLLLRTSWEAVFGAAAPETGKVHLGPLIVPFLVDGFSGIFVAIIAFMASLSALYSIQYLEHYPEYGLRAYYLCLPLFVMGMVGVVTVDDLSVGFTLAWQVMTIASYFLIRFEYRRRENVRSAVKYLVLMELAWLSVVAGTYCIPGYGFGEAMHVLVQRIASAPAPALAAFYGLMLAGFGMKAGVFPLGQLWLPDAHSVAPSPISALLSGVMIKTGIYGLLRTFFFAVPAGGAWDGRLWGAILAYVGAATLFIGTVQSVKQSDAKRLLAYSSIGQIGYIVFAAGAALLLGTKAGGQMHLLAALALLGALYHVLNHAVFKGLLFLTSGSVLYATSVKDLNRLGGLINLMPASAVMAAVASLSISGMPPLSGFNSKWTIVSSSLLAGEDSLLLVILGIVALFTSTVTLACYVKFFGMTFTSAGSEWTVASKVREVPFTMLAPKIILTAVCLLQGLLPFLMFGAILTALRNSEGLSLAGPLSSLTSVDVLTISPLGIRLGGIHGGSWEAAASPLIVLVVIGLALLAGLALRKSAGSREVAAPTWLCGYQTLNNSTRYADRNMFAPLKRLFRWAGGERSPRPPAHGTGERS
ncbi:MAG: hypothetical protein FJW35_00475 [Acidobacteria bacterium]|nr:hypothetical protein [Acidobacteriota bacterium]